MWASILGLTVGPGLLHRPPVLLSAQPYNTPESQRTALSLLGGYGWASRRSVVGWA